MKALKIMRVLGNSWMRYGRYSSGLKKSSNPVLSEQGNSVRVIEYELQKELISRDLHIGTSKNGIETRKNDEEEAFFELQPFHVHKLVVKPNSYVKLNRKDGMKMYKSMSMIRTLERAAIQLYQEKNIRGFCHLYTGQEATAVGIRAVMRDQDTVITSYRAHGWYYLMSGSPVGLLSELTGKTSGCSRGKGGSMHLYSQNFYGGNGIVGAQVPLGTGIALYHKLQETNGISLAIYGDGAANQGQVFESFNMAKLWNLPIIYVCENNHYGMGTSTQRASADEDYYKRGDYIPGIKVDGMDVLAVREATSFAMSHCQSGKGPIILEMDTYRYHGHSMSDPGTGYRSRDEVAIIKENKDPITNLKDRMVSAKLATESELQDIYRQVRDDVERAARRAREDPEPDRSELMSHVCKETCTDVSRGCVKLNPSYMESNKMRSSMNA